MEDMWEGEITGSIEDKEFLESLGVIVGHYNIENRVFIECKVSNEALDRLDPYWGRFYWSLN